MIALDKTFVFYENGKRWVLPTVLVIGQRKHKFETHTGHVPNHCEYKVLGFRCPKAGEWFLSGSPVGAYQAIHDQGTAMLVVEAETERKLKTISVYV